MVYDYPLVDYTIGIICSENTDVTDDFVYDELFVKGADIEYIPAVLSNRADTRRGLSRLRAFSALRNVFGCD